MQIGSFLQPVMSNRPVMALEEQLKIDSSCQLAEPYSDQILTVASMVSFCLQNITGIIYIAKFATQRKEWQISVPN